MKKMLTAALAALCVTLSFAAEEKQDVLVDGFSEFGRASVRGGYFSSLGGCDDFDLEGAGIEASARIRFLDNFAVGIRMTIGEADYSDVDGAFIPVDSPYAPRRNGAPIAREEYKKLNYSDGNLAVQLYVSLYRNDNFDIYLTAGTYYDYREFEYECYGPRYRHSHRLYSYECTGAGFLGGGGLELKNDAIGLRLEAVYMSKPDYEYDDPVFETIVEDKGQLQASGSLMFFANENVAFDITGRYFIQWEDLFAMFGLTVIF